MTESFENSREPDELAFLGEVGRAERAIPAPRIPDVRSAVWRRIDEEKRLVRTNLDSLRLNRSLTRWDVAAAFAVIVGAGSMYACVKDMMSDMYWSGSLHMLSYLF